MQDGTKRTADLERGDFIIVDGALATVYEVAPGSTDGTREVTLAFGPSSAFRAIELDAEARFAILNN